MSNIRLARQADVKTILEIVNKTTLDLRQKGMEQWSYPWDENKIANQVWNNNCYVLLLTNEMVGTFCIHDIDHINEFLVEPGSKYLSQIAILPEFQGRNLGNQITDFACSYARGLNKTLYLDCWAGNVKLKDFYIKSGFELIGEFPEENYFISIFRHS